MRKHENRKQNLRIWFMKGGAENVTLKAEASESEGLAIRTYGSDLRKGQKLHGRGFPAQTGVLEGD